MSSDVEKDERDILTHTFGISSREHSAPRIIEDPPLSLFFESAHEAVLLMQDGAVLYANPKARELIGSGPIFRSFLEFMRKEPIDYDPKVHRPKSGSIPIVSAAGEIKHLRYTRQTLIWKDRPAELWFCLEATDDTEAREEIRRKEKAFRRIIDTTTQGFMLLDVNSTVIDANEPLLRMLGFRREDLLGRRLDSLYSRDKVDFYFASREHLSFEAKFNAKGGHTVPVLLNRSILQDEQGQVTGYMAFLTDLTELRLTQKQLQTAENQYRSIYENAVQGIFQSTLTGALIDANPAYARILGYETPQELLGILDMACRIHIDPGACQDLAAAIQRYGHVTNYDLQLKRKDGQPVWTLLNARLTTADSGEPMIEGILIDNTAIKQAEEELRLREKQFQYLAAHDSLTGLYNTRYMYHSLSELVRENSISGHPFSLIFMDMDNFKHVVDTYGHLNGSHALQEVAQTIQECISDPAFGVAYGGDEFVVVLPGADKTKAKQVAESIRDRIIHTVYLTAKGHQVQLRASFGLANFPQDAKDLTALLALADQAMFAIKKRGKNAVGVNESIQIAGRE